MTLAKVVAWLDRALEIARFDDASNNGLQIARTGDGVATVAFAVDGSRASVEAAAAAGAELLVVHHGISWNGGIRRLTGGAYAVVKAAMDANLALYGVHLPLDASRRYGNNWEIARHLGLTRVRSAFDYHGNVIGVVGTAPRARTVALGTQTLRLVRGMTVGVCSGGAGEFAPAAQALGCDLYVTGEANWADVVGAENVGAKMVCCGHYETETFGVKALARAMARALRVRTVFVGRG